MRKIKLNIDMLVGYMRTDLTKTGIAKLGTAKLGCAIEPSGTSVKRLPPATKRLPVTPDDRA